MLRFQTHCTLLACLIALTALSPALAAPPSSAQTASFRQRAVAKVRGLRSSFGRWREQQRIGRKGRRAFKELIKQDASLKTAYREEKKRHGTGQARLAAHLMSGVWGGSLALTVKMPWMAGIAVLNASQAAEFHGIASKRLYDAQVDTVRRVALQNKPLSQELMSHYGEALLPAVKRDQKLAAEAKKMAEDRFLQAQHNYSATLKSAEKANWLTRPFVTRKLNQKRANRDASLERLEGTYHRQDVLRQEEKQLQALGF